MEEVPGGSSWTDFIHVDKRRNGQGTLEKLSEASEEFRFEVAGQVLRESSDQPACQGPEMRMSRRRNHWDPREMR
ncbi:hypothetical protein AK812_SmicGene31923 [Symbiodinium microadriaticum]|uniref:Uncharacterized protein n=1 Tax=Symbiodinium microadriaticum TaxID=2951 RepID=A0A1Q9CVG3_SYMMI|nr:hypothetical protein AK812_SmicGene31923 [Symbiodinium microadriaticum]